jgi:DNA-binding SARP family transcriptional activator
VGRPRSRRLLDALGAAVAAGLVFAAVPAVLVLVVGNPLHGGLGHSWQSDSRDALCALVLSAWVAWAFCCAQLVLGVARHVRRGTVGIPVGASVIDRLAARIALGVLAFTSVGAPLALTSPAGAEAVTSTTRHSAVAMRESALPRMVRQDRASTGQSTHVVRPGESLWSIADTRTGDGADWTSISALNLGNDMTDGTRFVDPDQLRAGWRLRLPPGSHREASNRDPGAPNGDSGSPEGEPGRGNDHLPELVTLGLGSIVSAALAMRARRRRESHRRTGAPWRPPSDDVADTAALLGRFDGLPALESFEAANRLLGRALHDLGASTRTVRAMCVGPPGVTFVLTVPDHDAPDGFESSVDGTRWLVPHTGLKTVEPYYPALPVALPVGTDDEGTWFITLRPGEVLPVLGESADALCRAARAGQEAWSWSDLVAVTDDPTNTALWETEWAVFFGDPKSLEPRVRDTAAVVTTASAIPTDLTVLVDRHGASIHPLGRLVRPQLLSIETSRSIRELTSPDDDRRNGEEIWNGSGGALVDHDLFDDLTDAVELSDDLTDAVEMSDDLTDAVELSSEDILVEVIPDADPRAREVASDSTILDTVAAWSDTEIAEIGPSALYPGAVDVRLLTSSPRIDGLRQELPPNRARRAVELVAYLALHHPDAVTSDRLRTRVLGSSEADAASKTLFNTAHAARRAMGSDRQGNPLFPAATRIGLYQVSDDVSIDVHRAIALAEEGKRTDDPELAMAYLRTALDLVESEPLAHALAGYAWWEAEGHGGRISAVLVDAACTLAGLAIEAGHYDLARRGLERARLVEPYSEALSRAAMEVAAAEGDAERLRLEWLDCQRRVDALDPGSSPSHRTESLYGELSSRVLVEASGSLVGEGD